MVENEARHRRNVLSYLCAVRQWVRGSNRKAQHTSDLRIVV
jgi:hypothetical protein